MYKFAKKNLGECMYMQHMTHMYQLSKLIVYSYPIYTKTGMHACTCTYIVCMNQLMPPTYTYMPQVWKIVAHVNVPILKYETFV